MTGLMASAATSGLAAWFEQQKMEFTLNFVMKDRWKLLVTGLQNTLIIALFACLIGVVLGLLVKQMKKKLGTLPLSVELPDFYPLWKKEGKISQGSVKDFAHVGKVMLQCSGNVPSMLLKGAAFMKEGKDMLAVIPVADHTSVRSGALRRRDWNDLVKSLGYFINSSRNMNCSGVVIRPLSEVGYMLLEQD